MQRVGEDILEALRAAAAAAEPPRVGEVLAGGGASAFAVALIVLCLPFLQPISLGPLSTIGGLALATLGWQLARGDARPWLPAALASARLDSAQWAQLAASADRVLGWASHVVRPRLSRWTQGRRGRRTAGMLIIMAGLMLAVPVAGIPFNNTLPAFAIVCAAFALLGEDGLMFFLAVGWLVATVAYFVLLFQIFVAMFTALWSWLLLWPVVLALAQIGASSLGLPGGV